MNNIKENNIRALTVKDLRLLLICLEENGFENLYVTHSNNYIVGLDKKTLDKEVTVSLLGLGVPL